ncbi:hypothetical protein [Epilithonimonas sp. UC225_85]|uniref:hypothetical protein n=1 Tax=Epilithonimonas sp. UC225_85 TaxID=3350167 RepID=UPI0036D3D385
MRVKILITILILKVGFLFSQEFGNFSNIENFFNLTKQEVEFKIKDSGYQFKSKDKSGNNTYVKKNSTYTFVVTTIFKGNQLKYFSWNDTVMRGQFIVSDIGYNPSYKIDESKTNDYIGVYTSVSAEKDLQINIFKTQPNLQKGMIAFSLMKIGNKKITNTNEKTNIESPKENTISDFSIFTYNKLIDKNYYEDNGSMFSDQFKEYYFLYGVVKKVIKDNGGTDYKIHITKTSKEFDDLHNDMKSFVNTDIVVNVDPDDLYDYRGRIKDGWESRYDLSYNDFKKLKELLVEGRKIKFSYVEGGGGSLGTATEGMFFFNYIEKID